MLVLRLRFVFPEPPEWPKPPRGSVPSSTVKHSQERLTQKSLQQAYCSDPGGRVALSSRTLIRTGEALR